MKIDNAARLRLWRKDRGFTQREAAAFLRVKLRTYKGWELGESPVPGPVQVAAELETALRERKRAASPG